MSGADVRKIKKLAARLGVHDSDVVRFAVKTMLARLEPLHDPEARGRSVLPVFFESGDELVRFFELDMPRLDTIINDGVESARRVDRDDVALIAMHATQPPFAAIKLSEMYSNRDGTCSHVAGKRRGRRGELPAPLPLRKICAPFQWRGVA